MAAVGLFTGVCTGHGCWPPANYSTNLITNVQVTKIVPIHTGTVRVIHCKPCGKNPACHPGTVKATCSTVMGGSGVPAVPMKTMKTGDVETDAILTAIGPKVCAARVPLARIGDSITCGSAVAVGAPNVLQCSGGSAVAGLAAAAAAAGIAGALAAGIFAIGFPTIGGQGSRSSQAPGDNSITDCD